MLLPVVERVLGPEHPHALAVHRNLAFWARRSGRRRWARKRN
jgi:hypothetical protein